LPFAVTRRVKGKTDFSSHSSTQSVAHTALPRINRRQSAITGFGILPACGPSSAASCTASRKAKSGFHPKIGSINALLLGGSGSAAIVPNSGTLRTRIETMNKSAKALRRWFGVGNAGLFSATASATTVTWNLHRILLNKILFLVAFLAGLLTCADASALMISLATTTLVDRASCIVEGKVSNVASRWTDDRSAIITEVAVEATDLLLGDTNSVTFSYEGGVVDEQGQRVSDMPILINGQQVLVFLRAATPQEAGRDRPETLRGHPYTLLGAAQGLHRIEGGRAIKDGFTAVGDSTVIDRNIDATVLKTRIRERLSATQRKGGSGR
jgi:hypothetical protein